MNIAVIQARMGSTRLPGKVLRMLGDTTILDSVVERLKDSVNVERIVVATTTSTSDESIFAHCKSKPIEVIRGPEEDVLLRFVSSVEEDFKGNILRVMNEDDLTEDMIKNHIQVIDNQTQLDEWYPDSFF